MPQTSQIAFEPRKSPVQARSTASVEAILQATTQVLITVGKERLTTTRVAARAGVSVGTLYQYFPNKSSLLQAALKRHVDSIASAMERTGREQKGNSANEMVTAMINAYLGAKMQEPRVSVALYSVSSDVDGAKLAKAVSVRCHKIFTAMLATAREPLGKDPQLVAAMLQSAMTGVSRRLLESAHPEKQLEPLRCELIFFALAYLEACAAPGR